MADHGVIGNPFRASAEKGNEIFRRFAEYLAEAIVELRKAQVQVTSRPFISKA